MNDNEHSFQRFLQIHLNTVKKGDVKTYEISTDVEKYFGRESVRLYALPDVEKNGYPFGSHNLCYFAIPLVPAHLNDPKQHASKDYLYRLEIEPLNKAFDLLQSYIVLFVNVLKSNYPDLEIINKTLRYEVNKYGEPEDYKSKKYFGQWYDTHPNPIEYVVKPDGNEYPETKYLQSPKEKVEDSCQKA